MRREISVVVPTYREAGNLAALVLRVAETRTKHALDLELVVVDDASGDGSEAIVRELGFRDWVRFITREGDRSLSLAVLDGFRAASGATLVVMDADLSHPPEKIPELLGALAGGADFAIGSRYVEGASTGEAWGPLRRANSRVATWLARPFTRARDPMSGFFALTRERLERARSLDPIGYKIGLELIVKCGCERVVEVPIHFAERAAGDSKLGLRQRFQYLEHVARLYRYRRSNGG